MDRQDAHIKAIRQGMIKFVKRYMADMDLMKNIVYQNEECFEAKDDILQQFDRVKKELDAIIGYNFYPEEISEAESKELEW